jgi:hypothetical protein
MARRFLAASTARRIGAETSSTTSMRARDARTAGRPKRADAPEVEDDSEAPASLAAATTNRASTTKNCRMQGTAQIAAKICSKPLDYDRNPRPNSLFYRVFLTFRTD